MTSLAELQLPPVCRRGIATFGFAPKSVADGPAIRLTKMWLLDPVLHSDSPPAQTLPLPSAARIGSPLGVSVSGVGDPLMSNRVGKSGCDQLVPPLFVMLTPPSPVP